MRHELRCALALIVLLAASLVSRPAHALSFPGATAPLTVTVADTRVCVILPKPSHGDCEPKQIEQGDTVGKSIDPHVTLHGLSLMRDANDQLVTLMVMEYDRGNYGPGVTQSNRVVTDFVGGLGDKGDKPVAEPHVVRTGDPYSPTGPQIRVDVTMASATGIRTHYKSFFFFGQSTMQAFTFLGRNSNVAAIDQLADRVMGTVVATSSFKRDSSRAHSTAEAVGMVVGASVPVIALIVVVIFLVRRKPAQMPPQYYGYPPPGYGQPPPGYPPGYPPAPPPPPPYGYPPQNGQR